MIIKSVRVPTTSTIAIANYFATQGENEEVRWLMGSKDDVLAMGDISSLYGKAFSVRHLIFSSKEPIDIQDLGIMLREHFDEYNVPEDSRKRICVVEHKKIREDGQGHEYHYHAGEPEVSVETGRVLDSKKFYFRDEKLSRIAELRLGHEIVPGKFNPEVYEYLEAERPELDLSHYQKALEDACEAEGLPRSEWRSYRAESAYSSGRHQAVVREVEEVLRKDGVDLKEKLNLPAVRKVVQDIKGRAPNLVSFLAALEASHYDIVTGRKSGVYMLHGHEGEIELGALHRLAKVNKRDLHEAVLEYMGVSPSKRHELAIGVVEKKPDPMPAQASEEKSDAAPVNRARPRRRTNTRVRVSRERDRVKNYDNPFLDPKSFQEKREQFVKEKGIQYGSGTDQSNRSGNFTNKKRHQSDPSAPRPMWRRRKGGVVRSDVGNDARGSHASHQDRQGQPGHPESTESGSQIKLWPGRGRNAMIAAETAELRTQVRLSSRRQQTTLERTRARITANKLDELRPQIREAFDYENEEARRNAVEAGSEMDQGRHPGESTPPAIGSGQPGGDNDGAGSVRPARRRRPVRADRAGVSDAQRWSAPSGGEQPGSTSGRDGANHSPNRGSKQSNRSAGKTQKIARGEHLKQRYGMKKALSRQSYSHSLPNAAHVSTGVPTILDLDDPHLMEKLAQQLAQSLGSGLNS